MKLWHLEKKSSSDQRTVTFLISLSSILAQEFPLKLVSAMGINLELQSLRIIHFEKQVLLRWKSKSIECIPKLWFAIFLVTRLCTFLSVTFGVCIDETEREIFELGKG